ncbi:HdeD family acid-resistance protein [Microbulbifer halophilus]|uniref:HdeD family acid-resistance protein n=1 Tax=Microbulbifer halophilus TaxID=453963 RepID=A0ABW5EF58_9GAMM|nr:HdeD family acid-resistance protein [Microbulbifer halophilus]MCW8127372.1 HdeD family acid-resistance protein [Microbulbifer halophilus]
MATDPSSSDTNTEPTLATRPILRVLSENWWLLLLRGVCALIFGLLALIWPGISLLALVILFGVYALLDGFLALVAAVLGRHKSTPLWWLILAGLISVAAGVVTFAYPQVTALVLVIFIGAWALVRGLFEIVGAVRLRREIDNEWLLIAAGLLSVIFGIAILVNPGAGAVALVWLIGIYAILFGLPMIWLAFRLRRQKKASG